MGWNGHIPGKEKENRPCFLSPDIFAAGRKIPVNREGDGPRFQCVPWMLCASDCFPKEGERDPVSLS